VVYDLKGRSMKAQMREANRQQARRVVILGDAELDAGTAQLKHMDTGEQQSVSLDSLPAKLTE